MEITNQTTIKADKGKMLFNGEIYSDFVILGKLDSVDNWREVDEQEVPKDDAEMTVYGN